LRNCKFSTARKIGVLQDSHGLNRGYEWFAKGIVGAELQIPPSGGFSPSLHGGIAHIAYLWKVEILPTILSLTPTFRLGLMKSRTLWGFSPDMHGGITNSAMQRTIIPDRFLTTSFSTRF